MGRSVIVCTEWRWLITSDYISCYGIHQNSTQSRYMGWGAGKRLLLCDIQKPKSSDRQVVFNSKYINRGCEEGCFNHLEEMAWWCFNDLVWYDYVHWFNHIRLHGRLGYKTPVEIKQTCTSLNISEQVLTVQFERITTNIELGSFWENRYYQSINNQMRDEFYLGVLFGNLYESGVLAKWWKDYFNTVKPHGGLHASTGLAEPYSDCLVNKT